MITIDITFVYQIAFYFILLFILNKFLFKPVFAVLEERKRRTEGALKEADTAEKKVVDGFADYDVQLKEVAAKAQEGRSALRQEASKQEQNLLKEAQRDAQAELERSRAALADSLGKATSSLTDESKGLSRSVAEKLLGRSVTALLLILILPSLAAASGDAGGNNEFAWRMFNFSLLAIGFYVVWKKFIGPMLDKRGKDIQNAIAEAEARKREAEEKVEEYKALLKGLDAKVEEIKTTIRLEAESERENIIKEAAVSAEKIRTAARTTAAQELKKAEIALKAKIASLVVEMATDILGKEITPEDQERMTKSYLETLRLN